MRKTKQITNRDRNKLTRKELMELMYQNDQLNFNYLYKERYRTYRRKRLNSNFS